MGNKHVISDLYQMQSLPLNAKVRMTQWRIREWVDEYGEDGVYISFSGGKDSSVYGKVVTEDEAHGQMTLADVSNMEIFDLGRPVLKTTGCERTGCMFCGYGCHLEKSPGRFEKMKLTHPKQYEYIMKPWNEGGLGFKEIIDWINEHGNLNIRY